MKDTNKEIHTKDIPDVNLNKDIETALKRISDDPKEQADILRRVDAALQKLDSVSKSPRRDIDKIVSVEDSMTGLKVVLGTRFGSEPLSTQIDPITKKIVPHNFELGIFLVLLKDLDLTSAAQFALRFTTIVDLQQDSLRKHIETRANSDFASDELRLRYKNWLKAIDMSHIGKLIKFHREQLHEDDFKKSVFERFDGASIVRGGNMLNGIWA